jgi:hypothetical protein
MIAVLMLMLTSQAALMMMLLGLAGEGLGERGND